MMKVPEAYKTVLAASSSLTRLFRKIWNPVWRALTFSLADDMISPKRCLFISIDIGSLSVTYASRLFSRIKIKGMKRYPVEKGKYPEPESLASDVALAVNELKAYRAEIILSIPKPWAIVRSIEFPHVVKKNLTEVIAYELDRVTPLNPENAYYDFNVLKEENGQINIAVVAAQVDLVNKYLEALRFRGFHVRCLTLNHSAIGNLLTRLYKSKNYIFLDLNSDTYDVGLITSGFISSVSTGRYCIDDEQAAINTMIKQIEPLAATLRKQGIFYEVVIYSHKIDCTRFVERFSTPVKILKDNDIKNRFPNESEEPQSVPVGGVLEALWPKAAKLNLLSRGKSEKARPAFMFTTILLVSLLVIGITYMIAPLQIEGKKIDAIEYQINLRKDEVKKAEALKMEENSLNNDIMTIINFRGKRPMSLVIIKEITTTLPKTAWLSRIRMTESTVDIEGYATSSPSDLLQKLDAAKYFRKVEFASPTIRDAGMRADRFVIKMEIKDICNNTECENFNDKKK
jgi:Tfp pilus assembly protein PilN